MSRDEKNEVKFLLQQWNTDNQAAKHRDRLRDMAKSAGFLQNPGGPGGRADCGNVGEYVANLFQQASAPEEKPKSGERVGIHELAKKMIAAGYEPTERMRDVQKVKDYIALAAHNPDVEDELPEPGFAFWRACKFDFNVWQARGGPTKKEETEIPW